MGNFRESVAQLVWFLGHAVTVFFVVLSLTGIVLGVVRTIVDTAAAAEARAASEEDKIYTAACDEHREATRAVDSAKEAHGNASWACEGAEDGSAAEKSFKDAQDKFQEAIVARNGAVRKMEDNRPKQGMARVEGQKIVRFLFLFALLCLSRTAFCASMAFYLSLESQIGCVKDFDLVPFCLIGVAFMLAAGYYARVGITRD